MEEGRLATWGNFWPFKGYQALPSSVVNAGKLLLNVLNLARADLQDVSMHAVREDPFLRRQPTVNYRECDHHHYLRLRLHCRPQNLQRSP